MHMNPTRCLEQELIDLGLLAEEYFDSTLIAVKDRLHVLQDSYLQYRADILDRLDAYKDDLQAEMEIWLFPRSDMQLLLEALRAVNTMLQYIAQRGIPLKDEAFTNCKELANIGIRYISIYGLINSGDYNGRKGKYEVITDPKQEIDKLVMGVSYSETNYPYLKKDDAKYGLYRQVYQNDEPVYVPLGTPDGKVTIGFKPTGDQISVRVGDYPEGIPTGTPLIVYKVQGGIQQILGTMSDVSDAETWQELTRGLSRVSVCTCRLHYKAELSNYIDHDDETDVYTNAVESETTTFLNADETKPLEIVDRPDTYILSSKWEPLINGAKYAWFSTSTMKYVDIPAIADEESYNIARSNYGNLYIHLPGPSEIYHFETTPAAGYVLDGLDWDNPEVDHVSCALCGCTPVRQVYEDTETKRPIFGCPRCYNTDPGKMIIPDILYPNRHHPLYSYDPEFSWIDYIYNSRICNCTAQLNRLWKGWWGTGRDCLSKEVDDLMIRKSLRQSGWYEAAYNLACDLCFGILYYDVDHKIDVDKIFGLLTEKEQAKAVYQVANLWAIRHEIIRLLTTQVYKIYTKGTFL